MIDLRFQAIVAIEINRHLIKIAAIHIQVTISVQILAGHPQSIRQHVQIDFTY